MQTHFVDDVGVHPDNREQATLVPVDAHDLLHRLVVDQGWSWAKVVALACEIPNNPEGEQWRKENVNLAIGTGGLLPPYNGEKL